MKNLKRAISILLAIGMLSAFAVSPILAVTSFKDMKKTDWHYDYVNRLMELKITSGYTDGTYRPNNAVTRAEFITFLCKALGHEQAQGDPFTDTQKHWASGYVTIALANGIIDLPADKKFRPDVPVTRLEAAEMICRAFNLQKDLKTTAFTDVSNFDKGYTNTVFNEYLMAGSVKDGKRYFYPKTGLIRGEVAAVVVNTVDYAKDSITYKNRKIAEFKAQEEVIKAEQASYDAWKESVKDIPEELLKNTSGLFYDSYYESNKALYEETNALKNWGAGYGMTADEMADEMVRVGTKYINAFINMNYKDIDAFTNDIADVKDDYTLNNYLQKWYSYMQSNLVVSQGTFITSTGVLVYESDKIMRLRGTMKYKYSSPTSGTLLNKEIVSNTKKPSVLNTWYEQDIEINFSPRNAGLKCESFKAISEIRIAE